MTQGAWPVSLIGRIYVGDHITLLYTKYIISGPHDFREDFLSLFFHNKSMRANDLCIYTTKYIIYGPQDFREEIF